MPVYTVRLRQDVRYHGYEEVEASSSEEARDLVMARSEDELVDLVAGSISLYADPVEVYGIEDEQGQEVS